MYNSHKISGVNKNVCNYEQKIAYNYCYRFNDYKINFDLSLEKCFKMIFEDFQKKKDNELKGANYLLTYQLILLHFEEYTKNPFFACNYETIGKFFTL